MTNTGTVLQFTDLIPLPGRLRISKEEQKQKRREQSHSTARISKTSLLALTFALITPHPRLKLRDAQVPAVEPRKRKREKKAEKEKSVFGPREDTLWREHWHCLVLSYCLLGGCGRMDKTAQHRTALIRQRIGGEDRSFFLYFFPIFFFFSSSPSRFSSLFCWAA